MALEESDFAKLGEFIKTEISKGLEIVKPVTPGAGEPAPPTGLEYYVHLADGNVVKLAESEISSHISGVAVIAKYLVGA